MRLSSWTFILTTVSLASSLAPNLPQEQRSSRTRSFDNDRSHDAASSSRRRTFVQQTAQQLLLAVALGAATTTIAAPAAHAIPTVTTDEFSQILRDSARSIVRVEFSGPQNCQVQVLLADGTRFALGDVIESPIDPRSTLKIAALCRANQVPTKFVDLEAALAAAPKRTKVYANERVKMAAAKEAEKRLRMEQDERDRLEALEKMSAATTPGGSTPKE